MSIDFSKVLLQEAVFIELSIKDGTKPDDYENNKVASFNNKVSIKKSFSLEENGIKIELQVDCAALNKAAEPTGIEGKFHLGFIFKIENLAEHTIQITDNNELVPSPEIVIPLLGAAYSTARGMIIIKVLGTALEGFSLPIVNAQSLLIPADEPPIKKKGTQVSKKPNS